MKKLFSIVLALVLALSLSVTAFAASDEGGAGTDTATNVTEIKPNPEDDYKPNPPSGKTTVNYSVTPAYTVTIPASVTIDGTNGSDTVTVSASGVKVEYGRQVVVKLTGINVPTGSTTGDTEFKVKTDEGAELKYTVTDASSNTITLTDNTVLTVNPDTTTTNEGASGSERLTFALATDAVVKYAGAYKGTVTFTVSVVDVSGTTNP